MIRKGGLLNGGSTIEVSYWPQSGKFVVCGIILFYILKQKLAAPFANFPVRNIAYSL
jgi:hypothetical protein